MKMLKTSILSLFFILAFSLSLQAKELKIATIAPKGTTLFNTLDAAAKKITADTKGRVKVTIYGGGVQGDEKDVVRKMRYGQLSGAALTGVGLGLIDPQIRVLELPFLFNNTSEVDKVYSALKADFQNIFAKKGYQLLGWAEVGFVKIFSNKAIRKKSDLKGLKMWMWEGDPLAEAMYKAMNVTPVPLAITDVLTSLQTNLIDAAYAPELGAIAFQWHTKVSHMTDINLVNGTGAIVLTNKSWSGITAGDKKIIQNIIKSYTRQLVEQTRKDNLASQMALKNNGIKVVTLDAKALEELKSIGLQVRQDLTGKLYSQALLDKVLKLLK